MKRILLFAAAVAFVISSANCQEFNSGYAPVLLNYETLQKKVEKSDERIAHERRGAKPKTWIRRGELFQDLDNFGLEQIQLGINYTTLKLIYQEPVSSEVRDDNVEVYTYEHMKYFFENGLLRGWKKLDPIHEQPLFEALRSYNKAIELNDEEDRMKEMMGIKDDLIVLKSQFRRAGQNHYFHRELENALEDFEAILKIGEMAVFEGAIDTLMITYCGVVAREIGRSSLEAGNDAKAEKMYRKAIDYYDQLTDLGYGGSTSYVQMTRDYYAIGDTLGAINNLMEGLKQYPDSSLLVTVTAQAYYLMDENEKGLEFVNQRIEEKPDCPAAYYWKGLFITNVEDVEEDVIKEALDLYDKSLELDPANGNVWYQTGYVNYAVGANFFEQESYEEDDSLRKELNKKGVQYYETASKKLEKTTEVAEDDPILLKESLDLLKRIYYKLYGGEDERYHDVNRRLNNL
ncbi:MAG: hypothetical protein K9J30_03995 [Bacteroidales bacterium]|nr:hypothetical protein [Bacteroidales bacterium]